MKLKTIALTCIATVATMMATQAQTWNVGGNAVGAASKVGTTTNFPMQMITNNATRMTVTSAGKVGIGTTAPTATFQVQKSTLADVLVKSTGNGAQVTIDRAGNGYEAVTRYAQTGSTLWKTGLNVNSIGTAEYVIRNENIFADAMTIGSLTNNVGIGTADLSRAKLVVEGNVGKTTAIFGQGSTGISLVQNWPGIGFNSYYGTNVWKSMAAGYAAQMFLDPSNGTLNYAFSNNAPGADQSLSQVVRMAITPDGRLILNSTNYTSTLAVKKVATANDAASFQGTTLYSHFAFGTNEDTYIRGGLNSSNVIIADLNNNVGIGTANPAYKLDVCGTMRAKEVRVATGWCDYVFADDYKLPSLKSVEEFIKENKHLPDVTPGAIIESEGLEVGKTSAQMIKKIEELTLYVIDLQKQLNELKETKK